MAYVITTAMQKNKKVYIEYEISVNNSICRNLQCRLETPELVVKTKSAPAGATASRIFHFYF